MTITKWEIAVGLVEIHAGPLKGNRGPHWVIQVWEGSERHVLEFSTDGVSSDRKNMYAGMVADPFLGSGSHGGASKKSYAQLYKWAHAKFPKGSYLADELKQCRGFTTEAAQFLTG